MNCLTYARVSTQEQADRELSLPAQQQAMRDYAERQGWSIAGEFVERGVSAKTADRPVLREMLTRCKRDPEVDVVLVHKIDRLARNVYDHATIRSLLKQHEIKLASVVENVDDTVSGQLVENIMASIAQFYSENLAGEVTKGMQQLVRRGGWPHRPPRGYKIIRGQDARNQIVIDDAVAPAVARAFEQYSTGLHSLSQVRDQLTEAGILGYTGKILCVENIRRMLKNRFYIGKVNWKGAEYPGGHTRLVSDAVFAKVQEVLPVRRFDYGEVVRRHHFWLRGVARCHLCGRRLTAERHGNWSYYRCVARALASRRCEGPFISQRTAEPAVLSLLGRLRVPATLKEQVRAAARDMLEARDKQKRSKQESIRSRKAKLEEQEHRLTDGFAQGTLSADAYRVAIAKLRPQIVALDRELANTSLGSDAILQKLDNLLEISESLLNIHAACEPRMQTQLLRVLFKQIVMDRSGVVRYDLHPPFDSWLREVDDRSPEEPTSGGASDLNATRMGSTIRDVVEFDVNVLDNISNQLASRAL